MTVRKYEEKDLTAMIQIWNEVVEDGIAFPQEELLSPESGTAFSLPRFALGHRVKNHRAFLQSPYGPKRHKLRRTRACSNHIKNSALSHIYFSSKASFDSGET
jgi:hypothetical protein